MIDHTDFEPEPVLPSYPLTKETYQEFKARFIEMWRQRNEAQKENAELRRQFKRASECGGGES